MKKLLLFLSIICSRQISSQTWVTIPDANFVTYLQTTIPSAMSGNQMDTSNPLVTTTTDSIIFTNRNIFNLSGIQYFSSLTYLNCDSNHLQSLPTLSNSLISLHCHWNTLTSLPTLPTSLTFLDCSWNSISSLPNLPSSLNFLNCNTNSIASLPTLPNSLETLFCYSDWLTSLPTLPNSLFNLNCSQNQITVLPTLPSSLITLNCSGNQYITSLPSLPNSITSLDCSLNSITCFADFSNTIIYLNISNNLFDCLPNYITAMDATTLAYPLCSSGNTNGCPVGINNIATFNSQIQVYPNPSIGQFTIEASFPTELTVELYDTKGGKVFNKRISNKTRVDVTDLDQGIYTLIIKNSKNVLNKKLVVIK